MSSKNTKDSTTTGNQESETMIQKIMGNVRSTATAGITEAYEVKVGIEGMARVGKIPQIKGVFHEIIFKDKLNANPLNIITGKSARLTKSTTAVRDDIVQLSKGKVVSRFQLKDAPRSAAKVAAKVKNGAYKETRLVGTKETKKAYDACKNSTKVMKSSGVSSNTTERMGAKALGKSCKGKALAAGAAKAGVVGAVFGAGVEAVSSMDDWAEGRISGKEYAGRIAKEGTGCGLASAAGVASSSAAAAATGTLLATGAGTALTGALGGTAIGAAAVAATPLVVGAAVCIGAGCLVKSVFDVACDLFSF